MGGEVNKFVARQAILGKDKKTFAYELLYRSSSENFYTGESPSQSTSQIIFQNHIMGNIEDLCMNRLAFINFDEVSLLSRLPHFLDKKAVVIELLEDINVSENVVLEVADLAKKGYQIALDDYDFSSKWEVLFPYVSFIKVDREDISFEQISSLKNSAFVQENNIKIVVERVETEEQFNQLKEINVDYYQGYFFHKPEIKSGYVIEPVKLNLLELYAQVCQPLIDFKTVSQIISRDVGLTSGVLKMVNLASEKGRIEITSVKQAVTFLGADKIKQYVAIIAMTKLSADCADELLLESLTRGKMMEVLSTCSPFLSIAPYAFITGLLSNISTILKCPLANVIKEIPLATPIKEALLEQKGLLNEALNLAKTFESSNANIESQEIMTKYSLSESDLLEDYNNALKWCLCISP